MRIAIDPAQVAKTFAKFKDNPSFQESANCLLKGVRCWRCFR